MSNLLIIVSGIGIIQSILFSLLILQKKNKQSADWILFFWFLIFAIHISLIILIYTYPSQTGIIFAKTFGLLHGPMFFLYTQTIFKSIDKKYSILHIIPFFIFCTSAFFVTKKSVNFWEISLLITKTISLLSYPIFIGIWIKKKLTQFKNSRADSFIMDSQWLHSILIIMILYAIIGSIHVLANILLDIEFSILLDLIIFVIMITIIGFYGLKYKIVYDSEIHITSLPEYKNSPLKKTDVATLKNSIDTFFNTTDDYLQPTFSLTELSKKLQIPKHHLSEIISLEMGTTFYDIVNAKRIQYVIRRMHEQSDTHITLEALGYDAGYNSKSSFYHHFKKYTGKTPRKYKLEISSN